MQGERFIMKKIVSFFGDRSDIFIELNRQAESYARERGLAYEWVPQNPFDEDDVVSHLMKADAGIIDIQPYGESIFSRIAGYTKLLVRFGVGYDKVDLAAASRYGIAVARTTGANTTGVAEMALSLILASRRQLKLAQKQVDEGCWDKTVINETVGSTIGILGLGSIGRALAGLVSGLNCRVIAYDPFPDETTAAALGVELVGIEELFSVSDAISIHAPYSQETHHLVNARLLALMKPTAVIVNTARGGIIDEEALCHACKAGMIRGAALDVYPQEPLPKESPLVGVENLILTPHLSSQTEESLWRIYSMAIDIAADFFSGKVSEHILNPDFSVNTLN